MTVYARKIAVDSWAEYRQSGAFKSPPYLIEKTRHYTIHRVLVLVLFNVHAPKENASSKFAELGALKVNKVTLGAGIDLH